jgi:6-phosphogluconolactonase
MSFNFNRRHATRLLVTALAAASLASPAFAHDANDDRDDDRSGKLFISSNSPAGNEVLTYERSPSGPAGAAGTLPASGGTAPAQVGFSEDGDVLVVAERNTQRLTSFLVKRDGTLESKTVTASAGAVPFGFAFTRRDTLVVSEAAGSALSSYRFNDRSATPIVVTPSLANGQGAACWIAVTPDGKFAFSANAATSSVSSYAVARNGKLSLMAGAVGIAGTGTGALDMAVSLSGLQLVVFASRGLQLVSFTITPAGTLVPLGSVGGMPAGSAGLAAN